LEIVGTLYTLEGVVAPLLPFLLWLDQLAAALYRYDGQNRGTPDLWKLVAPIYGDDGQNRGTPDLWKLAAPIYGNDGQNRGIAGFLGHCTSPLLRLVTP
jgi:hypothetical protein